MKTHLLCPRSILRLRTLNTTAIRMTSLTSPARQLRTLAQYPQLAISEAADDPDIRAKYRPFLLDPEVEAIDWISQLELETTVAMTEENISKTKSRLKVLVLYGSLRHRYES
jgi:arsenic resistance protein ArsH